MASMDNLDQIPTSGEGVAPNKEPSNFAFVGNVGRLLGRTSFTLAPGHELRRATPWEILAIRRAIQRHGSDGEWINGIVRPWETRQVGTSREPLAPEESHYFVIAFKGPHDVIEQLSHVFAIAPLALQIAFTITSRGNAMMLHPWRLFNQLVSAKWGVIQFLDVTQSDIDDIAAIHTQLRNHRKELIDVQRFTVTLRELEGLPPMSPLLFLGLFGILEGLLTHKSDPKDPVDSITRQIRGKVQLLDQRFPLRLDYSPFALKDPSSVWSKMYAYRSCLAHGGIPDFTKELKGLRTRENALGLLQQTVKAVLRQALIEPQLIADLRNC